MCDGSHAAALLTILWNVPGAVPSEPNVNRVLPSKSVTCTQAGGLECNPGLNNVCGAAEARPRC